MTRRLAGLAETANTYTHADVVERVIRAWGAASLLLIASACTGTIEAPGKTGDNAANGAAGTSGNPAGGSGGSGASSGAASNGGGGSGANGGAGNGSEDPAFQPGVATLRRLTREQYDASVRSLLGSDVQVSTELEADVAINGSVSVGTSRSTISPHATEKYETAAYELAEQAVAPERRARLIDCTPATEIDTACTQDFVRTFGRRAFRRPLTSAEETRYVELAEEAATELGDFWSGIEFAIAGFLQSPAFLFRSELGEPDPADPARLRFTGYDMAARLSFLFWNVTPDDALLDAAEAGELVTMVGVQTQAERLAEDPRARLALETFHAERLGLDELDALIKDQSLYPNASTELGVAMKHDILKTIEHVTYEGDYRDLFDTDVVFASGALAELYGVEPSQGDEPSFLPADSARIGIMGKAGLLAMNAHARETSPTRRGKFVRERLLCQDIPAPPPNVVTTLPEPDPDAATMRDRLRVHAIDPACSTCHSMTDPIGLAFEHFDALGTFRQTDDGHEVDVTGELDGEPFADARSLAALVRERTEATECVVRQLYRYANARVEKGGEARAITGLTEQFAASGYRLQALLLAIAGSDGFRYAGMPIDDPAGAMP
jgi:hypothetical protein